MNGLTHIGMAASTMVVLFGAQEVWDAYRHRDHPLCNPKKELLQWGALTVVWIVLTIASLYMDPNP
ncbi:MAG: hypothetical protein ACOCTH_03905 [Halodesulfurarchaeum sp.]